jgi:hypothetical protein
VTPKQSSHQSTHRHNRGAVIQLQEATTSMDTLLLKRSQCLMATRRPAWWFCRWSECRRHTQGHCQCQCQCIHQYQYQCGSPTTLLPRPLQVQAYPKHHGRHDCAYQQLRPAWQAACLHHPLPTVCLPPHGSVEALRIFEIRSQQPLPSFICPGLLSPCRCGC